MSDFSDRAALVTSLLVAVIVSVGSVVAAVSHPPAPTVSMERESSLQPDAAAPLPLFPGRN